jgi:aspartate/methionine/tyrosine aminotransferase
MITRALPDFALEVHFVKHEFSAQHHLTASDAQTLTISELLALATEEERAEFENLPLGYTQTWGAPKLREAIAATYQNLDPSDVLVFVGAQEAIYLAFQVLAGPGDHVIVTVPNYQAMESVPIAAGAEVTGLPIWEGEGSALRWTLDLDHLTSLIRPNTRVIAVNVPNNPTGFVPDAATWQALNNLCAERGILLFSDEVYRGIEIDASRRLPQAADLHEQAVSLNVMSKAYGLPGLRIGWLASRNRELLRKIERSKHYTSICNAGPSEVLATIALRNAEQLTQRNSQIVRENYTSLLKFADQWGDAIEVYAPDGGCVLFPRYTRSEGVEEFTQNLVHDHGALLLPASVYRSQLMEIPDDRFRLGIGRLNPSPGWSEVDAYLHRAPSAAK